MRILAIGLGGAGGRIVNDLYRTDRRSSKVACVQALAVDVNLESITKLTGIPENAKVYFPPLDNMRQDGESQTATIDIAEIASRAQTMSTGETDAVILFMGLGGSMADDAPAIITALRSSMTEPIFALVTLPCLSEGARCSAKAADQVEMLCPILDGIILFDNETWHKKVKVAEKMKAASDKGLASKIGLKKKKEPAASPEERIHQLLNDAIIRRVSLILRAGEFRADGGLDLAEVVLDAGEVLNTMKGMGFITIGYAVEQVPVSPLDFLTRLRPNTGYFADEHQKKASRIIDLAKQAIYHEISAPCDITSAHKALVLIAGPSHELSMKGFMTVRKWIDRSIAGLETRSGDYPVMSTRFVAIIIMLTGLENVPRIAELKEIRAEARERAADNARLLQTEEKEAAEDRTVPASPVKRRDEMISLVKDKTPRRPEVIHEPEKIPEAAVITGFTDISERRVSHHRPEARTGFSEEETLKGPDISPRQEVSSDSIRKLLKSRPVQKKSTEVTSSRDDYGRISEQERQRIEEELQRQRKVALGGSPQEKPARIVTLREQETPVSDHYANLQQGAPVVHGDAPVKQVLIRKQTTKKVIVHKKSSQADRELQEQNPQPAGFQDKPLTDQGDHELLDDWIRQVKEQKKARRSDDEPGSLTIDEPTNNITRDEALIHTSKKRDKVQRDDMNHITGIRKVERVREIEPSAKKRSRMKNDEDLSFVE